MYVYNARAPNDDSSTEMCVRQHAGLTYLVSPFRDRGLSWETTVFQTVRNNLLLFTALFAAACGKTGQLLFCFPLRWRIVVFNFVLFFCFVLVFKNSFLRIWFVCTKKRDHIMRHSNPHFIIRISGWQSKPGKWGRAYFGYYGGMTVGWADGQNGWHADLSQSRDFHVSSCAFSL